MSSAIRQTVNGVPLFYTAPMPYGVRRNGLDDIVARIRRSAPLAAWPLWLQGGVIPDISGNGFHLPAGNATNVTWRWGIDGRTAAAFNGSTSQIDLFSAGLAAAFNGAKGAILQWVLAMNWAQGGMGIVLYDDEDNYVQMHNAVNRWRWDYKAGGTSNNQSDYGPPSVPFSALLTWDKDADEVCCYVNNTIVGAAISGLGVFAGPIVSTYMGRSAGGSSRLDGTLSITALYDKVPTASERASVMVW